MSIGIFHKEQITLEALHPSKNFSLEAIKFQDNDPFVTNAIALTEKYLSMSKIKNSDEKKFFVELSTLIEARFNFKCHMVVGGYYCQPGVSVQMLEQFYNPEEIMDGPQLSVIGILHWIGMMANYKSLRNFAATKTTSLITFDTNKVKFITSDLEFTIGVSIILAKQLDLTACEFVAILMHEIGHIVDTAINVGNLVNDAFAFVTKVKDNNTNKSNVNSAKIEEGNDEYHFVSAIGYDDEMFKELRKITGKAGSMDSYTSEETYADSFASKFGLGLDNGTALYKLGVDGSFVYSNKRNAVIFSTVIIAIQVLVIGALTGVSPGIMVGIVLGYMFKYAQMFFVGDKSLNVTNTRYKEDTERMKTLREVIISNLRDGNLSKQSAQVVLNQIYEIEKLMGKMKNLTELQNKILASNVSIHQTRSYKDLGNYANIKNDHEDIETLNSLLNNELFVREAEFILLA